MQSKNVRQWVTAAVLLALTLVFQNIRLLTGEHILSTYLIGTLVNLCLITAAALLNVWAGLLIAVAAPLVALLQGYVKVLLLVPFLVGGNMVLVLLYGLPEGKFFRAAGRLPLVQWLLTGVAAAILKFAVIALGNAVVLTTTKGVAFQVAAATGAGLQVQQLVTAVLAMAIGYAVLPRLKKAAG